MKPQIDCLLIAFSGVDKSKRILKELVKEGTSNMKFPAPLNPAVTYLGTLLDLKGFTFEFINSIEEETERLIHLLQTYEICSIGITTTNCVESEQLIKLIDLIREINDEVTIILGGVFSMYYVRELEEKGEEIMQSTLKELKVDFIVDSSYGEEKLPEIISRKKKNLSFYDIPNLFVNENGRFYRTPKKDEEYQLKERNINWQLFKGRTGNQVLIRTCVSCLSKCMFCTFPVRAGKYNNIDVAVIEMNLNEIEKLGEVDLIYFTDDTFNIPSNRFKEILRMMIKNKYTFNWHSYIRCQTLDKETVRLMKESGCIGVFLGIESGSDRVLESMNKRVKVNQYKKGMKLLKNYDIPFLASFFVGFPGETEETVEETYLFIEEMKPDFYYLWPWYYDKSTPINDLKEQYDLKGNEVDWSHKDMDSKTAIRLIEDMKNKIKNSTALDQMNFTLLFQMLNSNMELPQIKNTVDRVSKILMEVSE